MSPHHFGKQRPTREIPRPAAPALSPSAFIAWPMNPGSALLAGMQMLYDVALQQAIAVQQPSMLTRGLNGEEN
jgi:hypothetical protein